MNAIPRPIWVLILLLASAGFANAQAKLPEPTRGKVLLLDNDRILEGEIDKINDQYRIRRNIGELWVPAARAKRLCKDIDETYEFMKKQVNLRDPDEHLRLARWCQMNGLKNHALSEAKTALEMRPDHVESLNLVQMLQRFAISSSPVTTQQPAPAALKPHGSVRQTFDVSNESFAQFATRVQPILINACASCHAQGNGGGFHLVRVADGGNRAAAQANLNAALEFINFERAVLSPLLTKAVVAHGGTIAAPIKGRQAPPFQSLQNWVDQLLAGNPHLKVIRQAETPSATSISAKKDYFNEVFGAPERLPPVPQIAPPPLPSQDPMGDAKKNGDIVSRPASRNGEKSALPGSNLPPLPAPRPPAVAPAPPAGPRDPFDPAEFNARPK